MRKRLFEIIELSKGNDRISGIYDTIMLVMIILSLIPLAFKSNIAFGNIVEKICVIVFIVDYILRFITADYKYNKKSIFSFIKYPFSFMAIVDLVSILPSFTFLSDGFKVLRILRMMRTFRVFKAIRYSKSIMIITNVFKKSKEPLLAVGTLAVAYILVSALIIFNVEPDSFKTFFDAVYWATVSLTTMGYGDIYPVTTIGRIVTMVSSIFGIAIVALPSGIITAGYMNEIHRKDKEIDNNCEE